MALVLGNVRVIGLSQSPGALLVGTVEVIVHGLLGFRV